MELLKKVLRKIWREICRIKQQIRIHYFARIKDIQQLKEDMRLTNNALVDSKGLGMLELMLHNAHIPKQHYNIFYKMFDSKFACAGGGH